MQTFGYGGPYSVSHTPENPFPLALRSPFGFMFSAALSPSAALCGKRDTAYSLFLNGFAYHSTDFFSLSISFLGKEPVCPWNAEKCLCENDKKKKVFLVKKKKKTSACGKGQDENYKICQQLREQAFVFSNFFPEFPVL